MRKKAFMLNVLLVALIFLMCGCGDKREQGLSQQENKTTTLYEEKTKDIFDPMGYGEKGYFNMTETEFLTYFPEAVIEDPYVVSLDQERNRTTYNCIWTIGKMEKECRICIVFQNGYLDSFSYVSYFYQEDDAKEYFLQLCERMRQITDNPSWKGLWERESEYEEDDTQRYREVPITEVAQSLKNNDNLISYRYVIDIENKQYTEYDKEDGYKPFDPDNIKEDARWIPGCEDAQVIQITYDDYSKYYGNHMDRNEISVVISIAK